MKKKFKFFLASMAVVVFTACGGGGTSDDTNKLGNTEDTDSKLSITRIGDKQVVWEKSIDNSNREVNILRDIATDNNGNLYVLIKGNDIGSGNTGCMESESIIIKFDNNGNEVWDRPIYGCVLLESLAVDNSGNAYAVGYKSGNAIIAKVNNNGKLLWNKFINKNYKDRFKSIVVDDSGNLYAVGYTKTASIESDAFIVKFDNDGKKIWDKTFGGSKYEEFNSIAIDTNGYLYAVGHTNSNDGDITDEVQGVNALIVKFDDDGNKLWSKALGSSDDEFFDSIIIDKNDNLYIVGHESNRNKNLAPFIEKYDNNGNSLWASHGFSFWTTSRFKKIGIDNNGNVYVIGETSLSSSYKRYSMVVHYSNSGKQLWYNVYNDKISYKSLVVDSSGNLYIAGNNNKDKDKSILIVKLR